MRTRAHMGTDALAPIFFGHELLLCNEGEKFCLNLGD